MTVTFRQVYSGDETTTGEAIFIIHEDRNGPGRGTILTETEILDLCRQIEEYYGLEKPS